MYARMSCRSELELDELALHPDAVHLDLPLPVDEESSVYTELLRCKEGMRMVKGKRRM